MQEIGKESKLKEDNREDRKKKLSEREKVALLQEGKKLFILFSVCYLQQHRFM